MADLKSRKKKKAPSGSPNIVLVVFLILFVLVSIVLGFFLYNAIEIKDDLAKKQAEADKKLKGEQNLVIFYKMLYRDTRSALGDTLAPKELDELALDRKSFDVLGEKADAKDKEAAKNLMKDHEQKLEVLEKDDGSGKKTIEYKANYKARLKQAEDLNQELEANANAAEAKRIRAEAISKEVIDEQKKSNDKVWAQIQKDAANTLAAVQGRSDNFTKIADLNRTLLNKLNEKDQDINRIKEEHEEVVKARDRKIKLLEAEQKELAELKGPGGAAPLPGGRPSGEVFPLLLDISTGKPLWDNPVGKIIRVDLETRQAAINLGAAHGVRPELTFNIFAANSAGRADKQMKGTIEVVKVLDSSTSLCRITSLYDAEGKEILLNLDTRTRLGRETENAIREGDLLFNLFWGTRVAVVGYVSITGERSDNPAEQIRQMEDFMFMLKRNGMVVDAFVDPRDGQIKGNITPRTRYLIRGHDMRAAGDKVEGAPAMKEGDDKDKEPGKEKDPAKDPPANADRNELINKSNLTLRKDAIDKGLLLISAENFANVIGYRKARAANSIEVSSFMPRLPFVVEPEASAIIRPPVRPGEEKKEDMEKKEMEKRPD